MGVGGGVFVLFFAPCEVANREGGGVSFLNGGVVREPVPRIHGEDHALHAQFLAKRLEGGDEFGEVLDLPLRRGDREEFYVERTRRRLAHPPRVVDGEAHEITPPLEQERVAEREAIHHLRLPPEGHAAAESRRG